MEGAQGSGGAGGVPGRLDQHMPGLARSLLGDPPVPGRLGARLAHPRVEAEIADQLPRGREAADLADRSDQRGGGDEVHARQGEQPSHLRRGEHLLGERSLDQCDLAVEKLDLAQAGRDRLLLIARQVLLGEPAPSAGAKEVAHRRLAFQVADQRRVHLVLRARALPDQLRPSRDPAAQDPRLSSGTQTAGRKPPASSFASVRASILSVFAPACVIPLTAFGFASTTRPTCGSMIRAIPSALPVASSATSSSTLRLCANSASAAGSVCTRPANRTSPPSAIATSQKSRWTSNPMKRIEHSSLARYGRRRGGRHDNYGSVLAAHPDSRRGGHLQTA